MDKIRYGFEARPLPAERGWGKMLALVLCVIAAVVGLLVMVLPPALLEDMQKRWAFYGIMCLVCACASARSAASTLSLLSFLLRVLAGLQLLACRCLTCAARQQGRVFQPRNITRLS